ncbi:MAG TPA: hypothetical protein VJI67_02675 [archaeon]|nr:hypothetical protein [archaeon]HLD80791.1 hypothetical protein [archaeon]
MPFSRPVKKRPRSGREPPRGGILSPEDVAVIRQHSENRHARQGELEAELARIEALRARKQRPR